MAANPLQSLTGDLKQVSPGDLITAHDWNSVVTALEALDARVLILAGTPIPGTGAGRPILVGPSPIGTVRPGDQLTLVGQNFAPVDKATVNFGPVVVTGPYGFGSDDTHLIFAVPNIAPQSVSVSVSTSQGVSSTSLPATVVAAQVSNPGKVDVQPANDPVNPPHPVAGGAPVTLRWTVTSNTQLLDTYTFEPVLVQPAAGGWTVTLTPTERAIAPGALSASTVLGTVTFPGSGTATVALKATSMTDPKRSMVSTPVSLTVGAATPTGDPRITFTVTDPQPDFDQSGNANNAVLIKENGLSIVRVAKASTAFVQVDLDLTDAGSHRFFAEVADTTHWSVQPPNPPTLEAAGAGTTSVFYNLTNLATDASPNATSLTVKAAKVKANGADDYVSFATVPLRNAG